MKVDDRGPVALVTGASRGIGRETALGLARAGFDVAVAARTVHEGEGKDELGLLPPGAHLPGSLDSTLAELEELSGRAVAVRMDLCDRQSVLEGVSRVTAELGPVDVLVNNAVYFPGNLTPLESLTVELSQPTWRRTRSARSCWRSRSFEECWIGDEGR